MTDAVRPRPQPSTRPRRCIRTTAPQLARTSTRAGRTCETPTGASRPTHPISSSRTRDARFPFPPVARPARRRGPRTRTMKKGAKNVGPRDARDSPRVPRSSPARDPPRPSSRPTRSARANARPSPTPPPSLTHHLAVPSPVRIASSSSSRACTASPRRHERHPPRHPHSRRALRAPPVHPR